MRPLDTIHVRLRRGTVYGGAALVPGQIVALDDPRDFDPQTMDPASVADARRLDEWRAPQQPRPDTTPTNVLGD